MSGLRIAYLCSTYPAVSHTFVLREVNALRRLGADVSTFSIRRAAPEQLLAEADRVAFESTFAILPPRQGELLGTNARLLLRFPRAYASTLALALGGAPEAASVRLRRLFYFVEAVALWRECRRRGIRHIHAHLANVATDVAMLACDLASSIEPDRPWSWSFTMHGPAELSEVSRFRLAEKLRRARFVICVSDYTRSQLMTLSDPGLWDRLHVIHCGIPIEQFTPMEGDGSPERSTILYLGRLVPEKGQAILLEAVALLAERGHRAKLVVAGEGPSRESLEGVARRLGIAADVTFPGAIGQEEIHDLYASASIFCLPSFAEGVPGVLMEAMAMGLPVVSTRVAGIPELVVDGQTGLVVSPGRPEELADALARLLQDADLCRALGSRGREKVVREFNTQSSAESVYERFAAELLAQPARQHGTARPGEARSRAVTA